MAEAEDIVRALAGVDPFEPDSAWCHLCESYPILSVDEHRPDCPWRLAREWVESHG